MKCFRLIKIFMLVFFLCIPGLANNVAAWKQDTVVFKSAGDKFSVEVPKEFKDFKYSIKPFDTRMGKKEVRVYKSIAETMGYTVMLIDYGKQKITEREAKELSEMARARLAKRGKVLSKGRGKLAGKPALVLFDSMDAGGQKIYSETWFALIDGKQFQLSYMTTSTKKITNPAAARFFTSFKYPVK